MARADSLEVIEAADALEAKGIDCRVLNMATVRPLDREAILSATREAGAIVAGARRVLERKRRGR